MILVPAWTEVVQNWRWLEVTNDRQPTCAAPISLISDWIACRFWVWGLETSADALEFMPLVISIFLRLLSSSKVFKGHISVSWPAFVLQLCKWNSSLNIAYIKVIFLHFCVFMCQFCYSRHWQTMLHCVMVKHGIFFLFSCEKKNMAYSALFY